MYRDVLSMHFVPIFVSRISKQDLHYYHLHYALYIIYIIHYLLILLLLSLSLLLMLLLLLLVLLLLSPLLLLFGSSHVYKDMFLNLTKKISDGFEKISLSSKRRNLRIFLFF